jgi:hypothetical protein
MERGIRIMHPDILHIQWDINPSQRTSFSPKPKITTNSFKLTFKDDVPEEKKFELITKGRIAFLASFQCNGHFDECQLTHRAMNDPSENRRVCQMVYEIKVFYSDLSKIKLYTKYAHPLPNHIKLIK